jgi:hypothetical protein
LWQVVPNAAVAGSFAEAFSFKLAGIRTMLHVNPGRRSDVLGSDEHPNPRGDARRCDE